MSLPRYPKYKDCGIEWLGRVPAHWSDMTIKRLSAAPITTGVGEAGAYEDPEWPRYIRITDIASPRELRRDSFKSLPPDIALQAPVEVGDLLIAAVGATFGKAYLHAHDIGACCYAGYLIRFSPGPSLDPRFAAYWTESPNYWAQVQSRVVQSTVQNFSAGKFRQMSISLPPIEEQVAIADFLDRETAKIEALIADQEKLMALLAEKRQATISHAVTRGLDTYVPMKDSGIPWLGEVPAHWEVTKCGRFLSVLSGFAFPSSGFDHSGNGTRLLRGVNVSVGTLRWEDVVYWERATGDGLDAYELKAGDLVIGMDRPLIAAGVRVAKVKEDDVPSLLLQRVALLRTSRDLDSDFLMRWLSTPMFVAHFAPETTGVSVPHISPEQIASFVIAIPPVDEQQRIISFLERESTRIELLIGKAERAIGLLNERRCALIAAAVTGQIDVRGAVGVHAA